MAKQAWKGAPLLAPVPPVLVSCGSTEAPNIITVAWAGIVNTRPPITYISLMPQRYSYNLVKESGEFVMNLPTKKLARAVDFCGVRSGKDCDKFEECKLTPEMGSALQTPLIAEAPLSLSCKVTQVIELGSHHMFLAEIVAVDVDERLIDKNGKMDLVKAELLAYTHGEYFALGERLGSFGFSVKKQRTKPRRPKAKK